MAKTRSLTISGDKLTVSYNGSVWTTSNGQQFATAQQAMHAELEMYFASCGNDVGEDHWQDEIAYHVADMS